MVRSSGKLPQHIESEFGSIPDEVLADPGKVVVRWRKGAYHSMDGAVTTEDRLRGTSCSSSRVLDVAGYGVTKANGVAVISLNEFHCAAPNPEPGGTTLAYDEPVNVTATARGSNAVFVTVEAQVVRTAGGGPPEDVTITVCAWNAGGTAEGGAAFYWRCLVPTSSEQG